MIQIRCYKTNSSEVIVEKRKVWRIVLDTNTFLPLAPKRLTWGQNWELISDSPFHCTFSAFCGLKLSVLVLALGQLKWCPTRLTKNDENFAFMTYLTLKMLIQGHEICTRKKVIMRAYPPPNFGVSSSSGSRDSRGQYMRPSQGA